VLGLCFFVSVTAYNEHGRVNLIITIAIILLTNTNINPTAPGACHSVAPVGAVATLRPKMQHKIEWNEQALACLYNRETADNALHNGE